MNDRAAESAAAGLGVRAHGISKDHVRNGVATATMFSLLVRSPLAVRQSAKPDSATALQSDTSELLMGAQ